MMIYSALQAGQTDMASELIGNYLKNEKTNQISKEQLWVGDE